MREVISSPNAPAALGPYSQGLNTGNLIFLSGQIPLLGTTGKLTPGGIREQTEQVITNIKALLATQKLDLTDVVKATVFLLDMNDFAIMNEVYASQFTAPFPARSTVQVARLPLDSRVEIEVIAMTRS